MNIGTVKRIGTYTLAKPERGGVTLTNQKGQYFGKLTPTYAEQVVEALRMKDLAKNRGYGTLDKLLEALDRLDQLENEGDEYP